MYDVPTRSAALAVVEAGSSIAAASSATGISRAAIREWLHNGPQPRPGAASTCFRCKNESPPRLHSYAYLLGVYLGTDT